MMLPVVFLLAFRGAASLKLGSSEAPRTDATIGNLLITDVFDADVMDNSKLGAETEKLKMVRSQQQPLPVEINHFAKCGGTYIREVAKQTIKTNLTMIPEFVGNTGERNQRAFNIGMIRNPFSYLVSLWAFGSYTEGTRKTISAFRGDMDRVLTGGNQSHPSWRIARDIMSSWSQDIPNGLPAGTTEEDRKRFARWVHTVSPENHQGFMSGRFYCKYLNQGKLFPLNGPMGTASGPGSASTPTAEVNCNTQVGPLNLHEQGTINTKLSTLHGSLAAFSLADIAVDCWIINENLHETMTSCFKKFEERAGPGSVDWQRYQFILNQDKHLNPTDHVECNKLYDDDLAAYVARSESGVIRAFGYKRC